MSAPPWSLDGSTVLLTGAAGAVGRSAGAALTALGARVLGADRNGDALAALVDGGTLADAHAGDLTDPRVVEALAARWPQVDGLVNGVGAGGSHLLADTGDDVLDAALDVNLRTAVRMCRAYGPGMARRGSGSIVTVSSVLAAHPVPTVAAYAAAKAALVGFTRSIALEYAARGVRCNVLAPGYLEGPKNAGYFASEPGRRFARRFMPTGAPGPADALDGPLAFLLSPMSRHVTGHVLVVDGGYGVW